MFFILVSNTYRSFRTVTRILPEIHSQELIKGLCNCVFEQILLNNLFFLFSVLNCGEWRYGRRLNLV